jgi:hypothetical protein
MLIWIDSFVLNQIGGNEPLWVQETSLRRLRALHPHIEQVNFGSDAGSGYRSNYTRPSRRKEDERLHFNASREEKCSDIDGHNTDIKSRRDSVIRAA